MTELAETHPRSQFLLYAFEWQLHWWEWLLLRLALFGALALEQSEAKQRFGEYFDIEKVACQVDYSKQPVVYLMTRKEQTQ